MPSLDRRDFLRHSFAVAASSYAVPSLLAGFFTPQDPKQQDSPTRGELLRAAWKRAGEEGKPLLVFVVPVEPRDSWNRGGTLGAFLNHGGPTALLELAPCTVACGTISEVQRVTGASDITGQPLMLSVDPGEAAAPPRITLIDPTLVEAPQRRWPEGTYEELVQAEKDWVHDCNERITAALRRALHDDGKRLPDLARNVRERLPRESLRVLEDWFGGGDLPDDTLLVRGASVVRELARVRTDETGSKALDDLALAARRVLVKQRIPGSKWATSDGCGTTVEATTGGVESGMAVACGMGHVPELCQRFLMFYTDP